MQMNKQGPVQGALQRGGGSGPCRSGSALTACTVPVLP